LPRVGALDRLRGANGDGIVDRARSNPWIVVAIAAAAILLLAWIGWAIYVTDQNGASAGLGVVIAWPALLAALALISLPFIGGYLLIKRLSDGEETTATAEVEDEEPAEEEGEDESEDEDEEEDSDEEESDTEEKAAKS
jgi:hypothetical protein